MSELTLFPHQKSCLDALKPFNRCAIYHDMGLGKTFTGAEKAISLPQSIILVVCQKSKVRDWLDHFHIHYAKHDRDFCTHQLILDLTKPKQLSYFISTAKNVNDDTQGLFPFKLVGVINYDLVFRRSELKRLYDFTLILDESSVICNEKAKRTKAVMNLKAANVILLSGTPTGGKYEKLWTQCKLLGWNISQKIYMKSYVISEWLEVKENRTVPKVIGYKNVEHLKRKLREHGAVFLKTEEVIDLPPKVENHLYVDPTPEYKKFMKNDYFDINLQTFKEYHGNSADSSLHKELIGDNILTKILYARQLCGQYHKDKLQAFKDLLQSTDDRMIVFYNYTAELEAMMDLVKEEGKPISILNGETKDLTAYESDDDSVTFIQYQAGSMGGNFQKANKMVFYTLPLGKGSCLLWEQAKKRIHRIGQQKTCFYYYLLVRNSIEIRNYAMLKVGRDYTNDLFKEDDKI